MPTVSVAGLSNHEKEKMEQLADECDMSTSEWARYRLRAGWRIWDASGNFDVVELEESLELDDASSSTTDNEKENSQLKNILLRNLSVDDALGREEVNNLLTEKAIGEVLAQLREEGKIEYDDRKGGYIKK